VKQLSAIFFSVMLVWAQLLAAPTPATPARPAHACCHCGGKMSCCRAPSSGSQPMPAVPAQTGGQNQISLLAPNVPAWALPDAALFQLSSAAPISFSVKGSPLYARDCARLI
jgi:hypothetical protein